MELRKRGVIAIYTFNNPRVMRLMPTLVIDEQVVDQVLETLDGALRALSRGHWKQSPKPSPSPHSRSRPPRRS